MKKILSLVLAFALVLAVASSAMAAFAWGPPASSSEAFGYKVEVVKFTRSTNSFATWSYNADDNANAVNGAPVYYGVKLTVPSDVDLTKALYANMEVKVTLTSITATGYASELVFKHAGVPTSTAAVPTAAGVYYLGLNSTPLPAFMPASSFGGAYPVIEGICNDTDSAKVTAKVTSESSLAGVAPQLTKGDYAITLSTPAGGGTVMFAKKATPTVAIVTFTRDTDGLVTAANNTGNSQDVIDLYAWLGTSSDAFKAAIKAEQVYMTNKNLVANFGFNHKVESAKTWNANKLPIILDNTVGIPKTGDNTSVVGFAMVMVALVAAAVAVKKVKA